MNESISLERESGLRPHPSGISLRLGTRQKNENPSSQSPPPPADLRSRKLARSRDTRGGIFLALHEDTVLIFGFESPNDREVRRTRRNVRRTRGHDRTAYIHQKEAKNNY